MMVVVALVAAGCSSTTASSPPRGGVLRIGTDSGIDSLNPFVAANTDSFSAFEYMYPELVQYNGALKIAPDFATSWQVSKNGRTWTFKVHTNGKWSDGVPVTASDVAWTVNTIVKFQNGSTASLATLVSHVVSASAPSAGTVEVHYAQPVANVLAQLQQMPVLPEHIWAKYATGNGAGLKTFQNGAPIVSGGPFKLTTYTAHEVALFERNPGYYGPRPIIDGFGLEQFSNDDAMVEALEHHAIDDIESVPATSAAVLEKDNLNVVFAPGLQFTYVSINANPHKTVHRELLNPLVREAFNDAINRAMIDHVVYLGYAKPGGSVIAPVTGQWHNPTIKPGPFNLTKAAALLNQAGYRMGPGGVRTASGHPMRYQVIVPTYMGGAGDRIFDILQANFAQIGVGLVERALDGSAAFAAVSAPNNKYLTFDMQISQWQPYMDPDFQLSVFLCSQYGGWNDSGYCNPAYDRLYTEQGTLLKSAQRRAVVWHMQAIVAHDLPYLVFDYPDWIEAHTKTWTGFVMGPQGSFNEMSKLTLEQVHQT